ncbi:MAG TPA: hypothetical protein DDW52_03450, partial [Planctomycetaceae bacterium]|nr:hypothetical protein [Planctomycetaceae bacterium]
MQVRNRAIAGVLLVPLVVAASYLAFGIPFGRLNFVPNTIRDFVYCNYGNGRVGAFDSQTGVYRAADPAEFEPPQQSQRAVLDEDLRLFVRFGTIERLDASGNQVAAREKGLLDRVCMVDGRPVVSTQTGIELLDPRDLTVVDRNEASSRVSVHRIGATGRFLIENATLAEQVLVSVSGSGITEVGRWPSYTPLPQQQEDTFNRIFKNDSGEFYLEWRNADGKRER